MNHRPALPRHERLIYLQVNYRNVRFSHAPSLPVMVSCTRHRCAARSVGRSMAAAAAGPAALTAHICPTEIIAREQSHSMEAGSGGAFASYLCPILSDWPAGCKKCDGINFPCPVRLPPAIPFCPPMCLARSPIFVHTWAIHSLGRISGERKEGKTGREDVLD